MLETPIVFDTGGKGHFVIGECVFKGGICIASEESQVVYLRNYISQTKEPWVETPFDETNPRHLQSAAQDQDNSHIITGIQTVGSFAIKGVPNKFEGSQLANALIDGTFSSLIEGSTAPINPVELLKEVEAPKSASPKLKLKGG